MFRRTKLFMLIPVVVLIPILLGMTPLNMAHKLASGEPFTHGKQICVNNHCPFHCLISHEDPTVVTLTGLIK
jgi:hypothetical protein